ncbi:MAG: FkbM family methyltransferase, partial [Coriobacteriia bacterium]|nr:FkbM family methyltransferase [Coriobacteriia bacterium]
MLCYPDNTIASQIWYFGPYIEWDELLFMTRYLRAGDGVIDAGANIGLYTLLAAPIVGPEGSVDSFEPGTIAAERLKENIELNGFEHVYLHQAAVSDSAGMVSFVAGWDVSNSMIPEGVSKAGSLLVTATTLDDSLTKRVYAYAKLDVEGAEGLVLRGASRMLADHNPPVWQVELCKHMLKRFGTNPGEIIAMFQTNGYVMASYDAGRNVLAPTHLSEGNANLLAIAGDRWEWV